MLFDSTAFLRLDSPQSLGASASGASFATSTGDILEVSCYGAGVFRMRVGPNTRPDYGLVVGRTQGLHRRATERMAAGRSPPATPSLEIAERAAALSPPPSRQAGADLDHRRAFPRLDAAADVRPRARRAGSGPPRSRSRPARPCTASARNSGRSTSAGSSSIRMSSMRSASTPARRTRTRRSHGARASATAPGASSSTRPATVTHGVGHPDWSHRSLRGRSSTTRRSISSCSPPTRRPAIIDALHAAHRTRAAPVPLWSLGLWVSRAYYKTPEEAADVAATLRERKIPCDVLTLDGRAAWDVETRFDFEWDPSRASPTRYAALATIKAHHLRICVWEYPYVSVHSPLFEELASRSYPAHERRTATRTCSAGTPRPATSPFGNVLTPLPESGIVDFTHPAAYAWWRDAHEKLFARRRRRDQERLRRARARRRRRVQRRSRPAPAQRLSAALQPVRVRGDRNFQRATAERAADGLGTRRLDGQPALSDPVGRRSAERLGRTRRIDPRRAVVGNERRAVSLRPTSAASTAPRSRPPSSSCAGCRRRCSARTSACTASASASRGRSARDAEADRRKWLLFRYRLMPVSAARDRRGERDRACR